MAREPHIVAIDPDADTEEAEHASAFSIPAPNVPQPAEEAGYDAAPASSWGDIAAADEDADWPAAAPARDVVAIIASGLALVALFAWTGLFAFTNRALLAGAALPVWAHAVTDWSGPAILIVLAWLPTRQRSRKSAALFLETARALDTATATLEARLTSANGELSLAREFLAAQTRDLDALGRVAVERIGHHAGELQALVRVNKADVEAIGTVSANARENMELLRGHLPVIASSAKDVANNIGNGGRIAQAQLQELINGLIRLNEFGQACERQVATVNSGVEQALTSLGERLHEIDTAVQARQNEAFANFTAQNARLEAAIDQSGGRLEAYASAIGDADERIAEASAAALQSLAAAQAEHRLQLDQFADATAKTSKEVAAIGERIRATLAEAATGEAQIAEHGTRLAATIAETHGGAASIEAQLAGLTDASVRLLELLQASVDHTQERLPKAIDAGGAALAAVEKRAAKLHAVVNETSDLSAGLAGHVDSALTVSTAALASVTQLHDSVTEHGRVQHAAVEELRAQITATRAEAEALAEHSNGKLAAAVERLTAAASAAAASIENDSADSINRVAERMASESRAAVERAMQTHTTDFADQLEAANMLANQSGREATLQLRNQLGKIDELVGNLEARVARARERAEEQVDNDFGRRMAVITEALNSGAIDIARALDAEVEDTAWAGYLRGDRGIFTRRAVRLLSATETKEIAQIYESDAGFANNVNRYIHDFESMLRQLLSTRDGHAMSVAMLSSEAGKLYVALAQAIDRLRD